MAQTLTSDTRFRSLRGVSRTVEQALLVTLTVAGALWTLELPGYVGFTWYREQYLGLFWALVLAGAFLVVPATRASPRDRVPWYDWLAALGALAVGLNLTVDYERLLFESALATPDKYLMGALAMALLVEATRRLVGTALLVMLLVFVAYGATAEYMPGLLNGSGASLERLSIYLYIDTNALLGIPLVVAATIVLAFILLGQTLFATGGGRFFTDLAMAAMGRYRGGPAKIAVLASSLFGTISGTAVSNVVTTGIVTIPLMRNNGYRREVAGAVEAVASTGGQIMPPVMGAAAFLIAEFLEISYAAVVLAALVPALLYYLLLFIQVDLTAAKEGLAGLPASKLPRLGEVMRGGWVFLAPLVVLIYALFWMNFPAGKAGMTAVGATVLVTVFRKATRPNLTKVIEILAGTGRALLEIGVITGIAGVIIGVLNLSGLGFSVSLALVQIGEHSLLLLLLLAALMSIILGMGMPTVSVYILLAVLVAPSLEKLGLSPIAAHLFILYFGLLSMITPPVAIASFAAAAISGGDPLRTGWESVKLGAMAYVVPFIFIFSQELLLQGTFLGIVWAVGTTALGAFFLAVALSGYLFSSLSPLVRLAYFASAIALFFNFGFNDGMGGWLNVAGLLVGLSMLAANRTRRSEAAKRDAPTG